MVRVWYWCFVLGLFVGISFWCQNVQIMSSRWVCLCHLFTVYFWCRYPYCPYFTRCEFLCVPIIIHDFVVVLFRIVSHEPAVVPTAIMELFPDPGVIGINCL